MPSIGHPRHRQVESRLRLHVLGHGAVLDLAGDVAVGTRRECERGEHQYQARQERDGHVHPVVVPPDHTHLVARARLRARQGLLAGEQLRFVARLLRPCEAAVARGRRRKGRSGWHAAGRSHLYCPPCATARRTNRRPAATIRRRSPACASGTMSGMADNSAPTSPGDDAPVEGSSRRRTRRSGRAPGHRDGFVVRAPAHPGGLSRPQPRARTRARHGGGGHRRRTVGGPRRQARSRRRSGRSHAQRAVEREHGRHRRHR